MRLSKDNVNRSKMESYLVVLAIAASIAAATATSSTAAATAATSSVAAAAVPGTSHSPSSSSSAVVAVVAVIPSPVHVVPHVVEEAALRLLGGALVEPRVVHLWRFVVAAGEK